MKPSVSLTTQNKVTSSRLIINTKLGILRGVNKLESSKNTSPPKKAPLSRKSTPSNKLVKVIAEAKDQLCKDFRGKKSFSLLERVEIYKKRIIIPPRKIKTRAFSIQRDTC